MQRRQAHVAVVDAQLVALADQPLGELDHRALAQVIGAGLEGEAEQADALAALVDHRLHAALELARVARQDRAEDRQRDVERFRLVEQRAQVLGQAGAAERKTRLQVGRRQIELGVAAEEIHHPVAVDLERLAQRADLVGEAHFQRVPGVVGVLHQLGGLDVGARERRREIGEQARRQVAAGAVQLADDGLGRVEEIVHRGAFAQEFRVEADAEIDAGAPPRAALERRQHQAAHGAGHQRAAHHHHRRARVIAQRGADLLGNAPQVIELDVAIGAARRADAHQEQVAAQDGGHGVGRGAQAPGLDLRLDHRLEVALDDRRMPGADGGNLERLDIHAGHVVAFAREAGSADRADVAQAQDTDFHWGKSRKRA